MHRRWTALALCALLLCGAFRAARAENGTEPVEIRDAAGMLAIREDPAGSYALAADIDMEGVAWEPLPFYGAFEGNGHTLYNLTIRQTGADTSITYDGRHRGYHTVYAALFSVTKKAVIQNLNLLNIEIDVSTDQPCYAAGIAGSMADSEIAGCSVRGRVTLRASGRLCGVGGVAGYGYGLIRDCEIDAALTAVAVNPEVLCEQFLGGAFACGYADVDGCGVRLYGCASVHGYAHNGGLVGMDDIHPASKSRRGYVKNCTVDARIRFFEQTEDRRAYCRPYIGEQQNDQAILSNNTTIRFAGEESTDYTHPILPEMCENPVCDAAVTAPDCAAFGYTTYTCRACGYRYTDDYMAPAHPAGAWEIVREADYEAEGLRRQSCAHCGVPLAEEPIARLVPASGCALDQAALRLSCGGMAALRATVTPVNAADTTVDWRSTNEAVVTVAADGVVTAVGPGGAEVVCQTRDGFASARCAVEVYDTFWQRLLRLLRG